MADRPASPVTEEHLRAFGHIIHQFARLELLIQCLLGPIVGVNIAVAVTLTAEMAYRAKRDTLKSFLAHTKIAPEIVTQINSYVDQIDGLNWLRNEIAHSQWKPGKRPGSIKPWRIVVRGGAGKMKGGDLNEPDYLADDLLNYAEKLTNLYNDFSLYLAKVGLLPLSIADTSDNKNSAS